MWKIFALNNYKSSIAAALLLFFFTQPFFIWGYLFQNNYVQFILGFIMAYLFLKNKEFVGITKLLFICFLVIMVFQTYVQGRNIFYLLSILPFSLLPFANKKFTKSTYNNFLNIYCFISFISLIVWLLALIGIAPQIGTVAPLN